MTNKIKNVPKLRFPEFKGEWGSIELGNIAENYTGGGTPSTKVKEYWEGNIPWIQSSDLKIDDVKNVEFHKYINSVAIENSSAKLIPENSIAIVTRVGVGKLALIRDEFSTSQDFLSLSNLLIDTNYALYALYKLIRKESTKLQGTSIKGLTKNDLLRKQIKKPLDINEQEQIGYFFSKLDRQIELEEQKLAKLEEQKKGYMQKIFSQQLRFKDEHSYDYPDWKRTKLINIVTPLKGQDNNITNLPVLTISASRGWLNQKERFSQVIAGNSLKNYTQVKKNDLSYNKGNSKVAKYGIVFRLKNEALVPNVYKSFRPNENIDSIFIEKYFHNKTLDKQLRTRITSTARTDGLLNISDQDFYDLKLYIPILQEQTKIADFLSELDKLIKKQSDKVELLKDRKKGFLQKMFV